MLERERRERAAAEDAHNGLDHECVASMDNITTLPSRCLGRTIGFLTVDQEPALARALILAFDLDMPLTGRA